MIDRVKDDLLRHLQNHYPSRIAPMPLNDVCKAYGSGEMNGLFAAIAYLIATGSIRIVRLPPKNEFGIMVTRYNAERGDGYPTSM